MGIQLRVRAHDSSFGGCNVPATMDKSSFSAYEWYGVGQAMYDVYLEFERDVGPGGGQYRVHGAAHG